MNSTLIPPWLCVPFAGLLLCVAVLPLVHEKWWETHRIPVVIFWILAFVLPYAALYGAGEAAGIVLESILNDYLSFIIMLLGLFCVAGNITFREDLRDISFLRSYVIRPP